MIGLDFETFSDVDIKTHGAAQYFESPNFQVLCAAVAYDDGTKGYFNFVKDPKLAAKLLLTVLQSHVLVAAHNASFEREVCRKLGFALPSVKFVDSAALARAVGAGSKLEVAAPQLLDMKKVELGADLIKVFSVPTKKNGGRPYTWAELNADLDLLHQWNEFLRYCGVDAELSMKIVIQNSLHIPDKERGFELLTQQQNEAGWFVDVDLVNAMRKLYLENLDTLRADFGKKYDPDGKFNVGSHPQLKRWCADRGVNATSFDKEHLPKLKRQLEKKILDLAAKGSARTPTEAKQLIKYSEVHELIVLKQEMGGSSLTKLKTILDYVSKDGRLRGQYLHVGAGQSFRTSGRGVQMQNLARLNPDDIGDMDDVYNNCGWDNNKLAENLRQVFMAEHPQGQLIVGDFKAVESRGLAYLAGEEWKLDAYRKGEDIYKRLATTYQSFNGVAYEDVTKLQRQAGKVGELACGYQAGATAVQGFAERMGIDMDNVEAAAIVRDWRAANPQIVAFWWNMDAMLHNAVRGVEGTHHLPHGGWIKIEPAWTPTTLLAQHPGAQSIQLKVYTPTGDLWLTRFFHGCYFRGNDINYYKPAETYGNGELWKAKMVKAPYWYHKLYGGKLTGILTQSFCRELFFQSMTRMRDNLRTTDNVKMIGQFHDELVLEWHPSGTPGFRMPLDHAKQSLEKAMSYHGSWMNFPLEADVHSAHRYIK